MRVVTLQDLHEHVLDLWGKADGIEWLKDKSFSAMAHHATGTIRIYPISSEAAYAMALHEIGHIRQGVGDGEHFKDLDDLMVHERRAWEWARDNALVWTPTMEREAERSLGDHETGFDEERVKEFYYKQIEAFVTDLLGGGRPDGLEVVEALVRNAAELAGVYEECGAMNDGEDARGLLLGLVGKYSERA